MMDAESASITGKRLGQDPAGEADRAGRRAPGEAAAEGAGADPSWPCTHAARTCVSTPGLKAVQCSTAAPSASGYVPALRGTR